MGIYAKPMAITKVILPGGSVDTASGWGKPQTPNASCRRALPGRSTTCCSRTRSTGPAPAQATATHPNAGKTGTTENHDDAWFDGYTRQLSTVVWMGYPTGEIPMTDVHGETVQGATFAVPIWHEYMAAALVNAPALDFPAPNAYPLWKSITRGSYGTLGYYYVPTTTYEAPTTYTVPTDVAPTPPLHRSAARPGGSALTGSRRRRRRVGGRLGSCRVASSWCGAVVVGWTTLVVGGGGAVVVAGGCRRRGRRRWRSRSRRRRRSRRGGCGRRLGCRDSRRCRRDASPRRPTGCSGSPAAALPGCRCRASARTPAPAPAISECDCQRR